MRDRQRIPRAPGTSSRLATTAVLGAALLAAVWLLGAVALPLLESSGHAGEAWLLNRLYAPTCHQIADRSFDVSGRPMALCARCTGLLLGAVIGLVVGAAVSAWRRPARPWLLVVAIAPSALDFALGLLALPSLPDLGRAFVGMPAGAVCGWFVAHAIGDAAVALGRKRVAARATVVGP